MDAVQKTEPGAIQLSSELISSLVLKGDLSGLTPPQKVDYYRNVCDRLGLDPATQPFQLLKFQGKEVLYCSKSGGEQLTKKYKISHEIKERQTINEIFIVYARAIDKDGRFEDSSGAVPIATLKGDSLANALMKAETKAKRRATLSLLGLSMMDETEIDTVPNAERAELPTSETATIKQEPAKAEPQQRTGTVHEAQIIEEPKQQPVSDISDRTPRQESRTFDPTEAVTFGKYKGMAWQEVPGDYIQWMAKNATKADIKARAVAMLQIHEMEHAQSENVDAINGKDDLPF